MAPSENTFSINEEVLNIYAWCVYGALCESIIIFGIVTNIINIICFVKQGFKDPVNISLLGLSISDLGSLVTMIWTSACLTPGLMTADLSYDPLEIAYLTTATPHFAFTRISSCITAMITLERCVCITAPFKINSIFTPSRVANITVCIFIISFLISTPIYVVNSFEVKFSPIRNKTLLGLLSTKDREITEAVTYAINNFFIPFCSFFIIVVCTTILSITLNINLKWRLKFMKSAEGDAVSSRNKKTTKMIVIVSTLFIVCFVPISVVMLAIGLIPDLSMNGKYFTISIIIGGYSYVMASLNASVNIFIYFHMSRKYRDVFNKFICFK